MRGPISTEDPWMLSASDDGKVPSPLVEYQLQTSTVPRRDVPDIPSPYTKRRKPEFKAISGRATLDSNFPCKSTNAETSWRA